MSKDQLPKSSKLPVAPEFERAAQEILPNVEFPEGFFHLMLERGGTEEWMEKFKTNCNAFLNANIQTGAFPFCVE